MGQLLLIGSQIAYITIYLNINTKKSFKNRVIFWGGGHQKNILDHRGEVEVYWGQKKDHMLFKRSRHYDICPCIHCPGEILKAGLEVPYQTFYLREIHGQFGTPWQPFWNFEVLIKGMIV